MRAHTGLRQPCSPADPPQLIAASRISPLHPHPHPHPASQLHLMNAHPIVNLPRGGGPKSEAAVGFVTGMLGKCVRLAVLHVCFSQFGPTKTRFCWFLGLFLFGNDQLGKCVCGCASGGERAVRRAADSPSRKLLYCSPAADPPRVALVWEWRQTGTPRQT